MPLFLELDDIVDLLVDPEAEVVAPDRGGLGAAVHGKTAQRHYVIKSHKAQIFLSSCHTQHIFNFLKFKR